MNEGLIPRRYANALFLTAREKGCERRLYDIMLRLEQSFAATPDLQDTLSNPFVSEADKCRLLTTAAGATGADTLFADFLRLLCRNRRIEFMRGIALAFLDIYRRENHIYVVRVESAAPLAPEEEQRIKRLVQSHIGDGTMEYTAGVNPTLIGGFTVAVGNDRIDASVSNELKQLRLNLLSK